MNQEIMLQCGTFDQMWAVMAACRELLNKHADGLQFSSAGIHMVDDSCGETELQRIAMDRAVGALEGFRYPGRIYMGVSGNRKTRKYVVAFMTSDEDFPCGVEVTDPAMRAHLDAMVLRIIEFLQSRN